MSAPYNTSSGLAYDGHTTPSEFVVQFQDWLSGANLNKQDGNHIRRLALLKQSLKPLSRARIWYEARQQSSTPFTTLSEALDGIQAKFYTTGMQAREMQEIDDPSFIQEDSETVQDFSSRFTAAMIASERGRAALRMGPRSEAEYGLSFRRKLLPYLQADLQRFNIAYDKTVEELTVQLEHYERAVHTINQYRRIGQLRAEAHGFKRAAVREDDSPRPNKTHVLAPILGAEEKSILLAEQVARQQVQIERMTRAEEDRKRQRSEQLRLEAEEARQRGLTQNMIAQITERVRGELQGHQQWQGQQGRDGGAHAELRCFTCHTQGHFARDCRERNDNCHRCGMQRHRPPDWQCPAYQSQCRTCGGAGHFEKVCLARRAYG